MTINKLAKLWTREYILLIGVTILSFLCLFMGTPIIPLYVVEKFNSSTAEVGLISSAMIISSTIIRPFAGYAVDHWGRRVTLYIALVISMLCNFSLLLPLNFLGLLISRVFLGIPIAVITNAISTLVSDITHESKRSEGMSYYVIISTLIAASLGANLGLMIFGENRYNTVFICSGIFAILSILLCVFMRYKDIKNPKAAFSLKSLFEGKVIWLALVQCLCWSGAAGFMTYSTLYAKSAGFAGIGTFFLLYGVGLLVSRFLTRITFDKKGPKVAVIMAISLLFMGYALIGFIHREISFVTGALFLGAGYGLLNSTLLSMAMQVVIPERRGACNATMYFGQDGGISLGSFLMGLVIDATGSYTSAYSSVAIFMIMPFLLFIFVAWNNFKKKKLL